MNALIFAVSCLATFRVASMFATETGPGGIFKKLRAMTPPRSSLREGVECFYCESMWWAAAVSALLLYCSRVSVAEAPLYWLGVSGGAVVIHRTVSFLS